LGEGSTLSFTLPMAAAGAEPTNVAGVVDDPSVVDLRINPALLPVVRIPVESEGESTK
jgi:hypothetical protein